MMSATICAEPPEALGGLTCLLVGELHHLLSAGVGGVGRLCLSIVVNLRVRENGVGHKRVHPIVNSRQSERSGVMLQSSSQTMNEPHL